jgi:plastocyanin
MNRYRSAVLTGVAVCGTFALLSCGGSTSDTTEPPVTATTASISGKVLDTDSALAGVAGATVTFSGAGAATVTSQSNGSFLASSLQPGAYSLTLTPPAGYVLSSGENGTRNITVAAAHTAAPVADFQLARTRGDVAGSVKNGAAPLASASVSLTRPGFAAKSAVTDAAGSFTFAAVPRGVWTATVSVPSTLMLGANESGTRTVSVTANQTSQLSAFSLDTRPSENVVIVHISGTTFTPANLSVTAGTKVRWVNDVGGTHTITPQNASQAGVFPRVTFGGQAGAVVLEHTFSTPGQTYPYRCELHSDNFTSGMVGQVTVQ